MSKSIKNPGGTEVPSDSYWFGHTRESLNKALASDVSPAGRPSIEHLAAVDSLLRNSAVIHPDKVYDLSHELEYSRNDWLHETEKKHLDFSIHIAPDLPTIYAETNSLRIQSLRINVIDNILRNAMLHTPMDGKISLTFEKSGESLCILITDTGPAIPVSARENIQGNEFNHDQPVNNTRYGPELLYALQSIQAHSGTLSIIEPPTGIGVTFRIEMPIYTGLRQPSPVTS